MRLHMVPSISEEHSSKNLILPLFAFGFILFIFTYGCIASETDNSPSVQLEQNNTISDEEAGEVIEEGEIAEEGSGLEEEIEENNTLEEEPEVEEQLPIIVEISEPIESNCIGFLVGNEEEIEAINSIGAGWTRPHSGPFVWGFIEQSPGEYDFSVTDDYAIEAGENNIAILATVWPFADWDQEENSECEVNHVDQFYPKDPMELQGIPAYRCKPNDMQAYKQFLFKLVERYDGDGIEDMPGLKIPIKYWEILNEPEMKAEDLTFFIGDEEDYLEVLQESYGAIKQSCHDCKVLHGGCASSGEFSFSFWEKIFQLGGENYFDIANIHFISFGDTATLNVAPFKSLLEEYNIEKPIWVTEAEFSGSDAEVLTITKGALDAGAEKIFYVGFWTGGHEGPKDGKYDPIYEETVGLCN